MPERIYDLAIIGGGPGGYVSAIRARQLGLKTALIERAELGGVCLNWGCIPTKALLRNAEVVSLIKRAGEFGVDVEKVSIDYSKAVERSKGVVKRLKKGVEFLLKKNGVEVIRGEGRLLFRDTIGVKGVEAEKEIKAKSIIIATGSKPLVPEGITVNGKNILTSNEVLSLTELPQDMVIIGGGAVGSEFAYMFATYGVKVTIVEAMPHILPGGDEEIAGLLTTLFKKMGIEVLSGYTLSEMKEGDRLRIRLTSQGGGKEIEAQSLLVAIGRSPNSGGGGLKGLGIELDKGFIKTDDYMEVSVSGIYAIGDVASPPLLAHKAMTEGVLAVERIAGKDVRPIDRLSIPLCIYTEPQVAFVGLTEKKAKEAGYKTKVSTFPFRANGKALAMGESDGFVKVIADEDTGELLGCHMIGPEVTELIGEVALARLLESTAVELNRTFHPHPTLSEALMEAAGGIFGGAIHI